MKTTLRRRLRLVIGRLRRFNRVLKGEGAGVASHHLRSTLLPQTTKHLTAFDRLMIFMTSSPLPIALVFVVVVTLADVVDRYKDVTPVDVELLAAGLLMAVCLFYRNVRSLGRANGAKILLLRRFHTEKLPAYPLSRVMHRLVERGYQVVTLRDSIVDADRETLSVFSELIVMALSTAIWFGGLAVTGVLLFLCLKVNASATFAAITQTSVRWAIYTAEIATATLYMGSLRKGRSVDRLMKRAISWGQAKAAELFTRQARPLGSGFGDFRHRGQLSMRVIQADDDTWLRDVQALMDASDVVIIDLSNPSENVRMEVIELGRRQGRLIPIWLKAAHQTSLIRRHHVGYEVLGVTFKDSPIEATYPSRRATKHDYQRGTNAALNPWEYLAAATLASTIESAIEYGHGARECERLIA